MLNLLLFSIIIALYIAIFLTQTPKTQIASALGCLIFIWISAETNKPIDIKALKSELILISHDKFVPVIGNGRDRICISIPIDSIKTEDAQSIISQYKAYKVKLQGGIIVKSPYSSSNIIRKPTPTRNPCTW